MISYFNLQASFPSQSCVSFSGEMSILCLQYIKYLYNVFCLFLSVTSCDRRLKPKKEEINNIEIVFLLNL